MSHSQKARRREIRQELARVNRAISSEQSLLAKIEARLAALHKEQRKAA